MTAEKPDASVLRATDPEVSAWVSANAGAGKTHLLANRVTRLLLKGTNPARILCLTYTKAAAAEMSSRLFERLGQWALLPDAALQAALAEIGADAIDADALKRARRLFAQALETPGGLKIQTIHSFCEMVLSRFPLEAGVPPRFQVLDERSQAERMRTARNAVLERASKGDGRLASAISTIAVRASDVRFGELVDLAIGARRGRLAELIARNGGEPKGFFAHLRKTLGAPDADEATLLTQFCEGICGERDTCRRAAEWLLTGTGGDQDRGKLLAAFVECGMAPHRIEHLRDVFLTDSGTARKTIATKDIAKADPALFVFLQDMQNRVVALEAQYRAARVARLTEALVITALAVVEEYDRLKRLRAALDYDDLIVRTRDLVTRGDTAAWVMYKLDGGIEHILVDEAQDTSPEQWRIVGQLAEEFFAGRGAHESSVRTLFAVGDEKQSIFSFQGAAPEEFGRNRSLFGGRALAAGLAFEDAHPAESRRSTVTILDFVDAVFAQDAARDGLTFANEPIRHEAKRRETGRVEVWPTVPQPTDDEPDLWDPVDALPRHSAQVQLAQKIAARIKNLLKERPYLPTTRKGMTAGDVMILVRRRNAFAQEMIRQLINRGVPVAGADRMILMDQMAIQDLVALGRFTLLPEDDLNLAALLKSPFLNLDEDHLFDLAHGREQNLWKTLEARKDERPEYAAAHAFLATALSAADTAPPFEFYARILGRGVRRKIVARLGDDAADAIDEFLALALAHEGAYPPSLESFLDWFEKGGSEVKRDMEQAGGAVRVMTVHGAKGLEAPIVIVPDTTQIPMQDARTGLLYTDDCVLFGVPQPMEVPAVTAAKRAAHVREMREYRRLLYVALTRARDWLIVAGYEMKRPPVHAQSWYPVLKIAAEQMGAVVDENGVLVVGDPIMTGAVERRAEDAAQPLPSFLRMPAPNEPVAPRILRPFDAAGEEEPVLLSPLAGNGKRFRRGLLIHALLAALPNAPENTRAQAAKNYLAREGVAPAEAAEIANETLAVLAHPDFASLFAEGSRAEVPIVANLPELGPGIRVSGQIDRLAVSENSVLVADFKTNRPPPATPELTPAYYRAQMALYREALKKIYPAKRVTCALIWTDGTRLMPLPDALLDAELAKITQRVVENTPP